MEPLGKCARPLAPLMYLIMPWLSAIAFFMQTLDAAILNTALPAMAWELQVSSLNMQSAIISYSMTLAICIPISGFLSDRWGSRRIFILSVLLFTLGSLFCALAETLLLLDVARVIQGLGGAMMVPVSRLVLIRSFAKHQFLAALNTATLPGLIGPIIGPLLGGYLVDTLSWHWIF